MLGLCLQQSRRLRKPLLQLERVAVGRRPRERLDPSYTSRRAGFVREAKQRELPRRGDVGAAAQLERHTGDIHHAHHVAVLLAEQRHRSRGHGVLIRHLPGFDGQVFPDVGVHLGLDRPQLIAFDRAVVTKVEAQPFRSHYGARLTHVRAEDFAQRRVHEVRRRMIALDVAASRLVDLRAGGRRLECLPERTNYGGPAVHLLHIFDRELPSVAFHDTGVADLTARLRVERILFENQLELVPGLAKRDRLGLGLGGVVPDPLLLALLF